jgi:hypothetical protein
VYDLVDGGIVEVDEGLELGAAVGDEFGGGAYSALTRARIPA